MSHIERVMPPYRRAVVDPYVTGYMVTSELCSLIEGELYLLMKTVALVMEKMLPVIGEKVILVMEKNRVYTLSILSGRGL